MRYLKTGIIMVFLSPLLLFIIFELPRNLLVSEMIFSGELLFIIAVQITGLVLSFMGRRRAESVNLDRGVFNLLSGCLIVWGVLITFFGLAWYGILVEHLRYAENPSLSIWTNLEYGAWVTTGVLGIVAGLILIFLIYLPARVSEQDQK